VSVSYTFTCDGCSARGVGVAGDYIHPDPPLGWTWRFGSSLEGPHACSSACWDRVKRTDDGKIILHMNHEKLEARRTGEPPPLPQIPEPPPRPPRASTWVYFAQRGEDGPIKIGMSKHPISRVKDLGAASAEGLRLLGVVPGGRRQEVELHTMFSGARLNGEWFRPVLHLKDYIATHASMP
jgi:hypothetical protein